MGHITDNAIELLKAILKQAEINCDTNTDEQALAVKVLYPEWADIKDEETLAEGRRLNYEGVLYKVIQTHDKQSTYNPKDAVSLFTPIDESHAGTIDDPIPWVSGMECVEGLYYAENDIIYLCIRSSGTGLHYNISALIGTYFEVVTE